MAQFPSNMDMDVNINTIRERSALTSKASSRSLSISLSTLSILYHFHMELNNDLPNTVSRKPIDSSQLSYTEGEKVEDLVRPVTDKDSTSNSQHVCNKAPALKNKPKSHGKGKDKIIDRPSSSSSENIINI